MSSEPGSHDPGHAASMPASPSRSFLAVLRIVLPALLAGTGTALAQLSPPLPDGFYRYPSIGGGQIVFASEGDLWKVSATGGTAMRLTAHEGEERFPRISPDGKWVAFTAQYEGNDDVYVMPASGGEPVRLTWHPMSDQAIGWTADGKVLFRSRRDHPHGDYRVYTVDPTGAVPQLIPLEPCAWLSFEPGGSRVAAQKIGLEFHNWKRYKGGEAEQIYVGTLDPLRFTEITKYDGKDAFPMWASDGRIYFVSDRWGRPNLASMDPDGGAVKRHTAFADYDVRWPAMGDGKIVYQHMMDIWMYDLASARNEKVPVSLPSDRLQVRERYVDPHATIQSWTLSKDGQRIALESRGDLFVARTSKKGLIRRVTESSISRTKFPAFSPDGKWLAAWTEVEGEEQLMLHSADNSADAKQVGAVPPGWYMEPVWSPDGKSIAWGDQRYHLYVTDVAGGARAVVDSGEWEIRTYEWSPDSRYLAYHLAIPNGYSQVRIWDSKERRSYSVSDPMFNSRAATWDPNGRYLYYLSDRAINPYLDRNEARFIVTNATVPVVVALQADSSLPFAARSDVDPASAKNAEPAKKSESEKEKPGGGKDGEQARPIRIDFNGLAGRIVLVPVPPGNYFGLRAAPGRLLFANAENRGMAPPGDDGDAPGATLLSYDLEKEKAFDHRFGRDRVRHFR
jgi:tricorn protease